MARKRVRVDTSRLRAMGETQRVVARPVDTYIRPALQTNPQSEQLVNALATLNPAIKGFIADKKEELKSSERELGEKSFYEATPEERKELEQQIKKGEIDETQSPFWVEGFTRSLLRNHANELGEDMIIQWDIEKDKSGFDFDNFVSQQRTKYIKDNALDVFRADIFNDEFGDFTQKFEAQVRQRNFEHRLAKARKARVDSMLGEMDTVLTNIDNNLDGGTFNPITASENINAIIDSAIKQGNDPKAVIDATVGFLRGAAIEQAGSGRNYESILAVLDKLKLKHGTYGITYKDDLENLRDTLEGKREAWEDEEFKNDIDERKERAVELTDDLMNGLVDNKYSEKWFNSEATRAKRDELARLDATLGTSMLTDVNGMFQDKGEVVQGGDTQTFQGLVTRIDNNENVREQIMAAYKNKSITFAERNALLRANDSIYGTFVTNNGIQGIPALVANSVKQKGSPLTGLLSDASRNRFAAEASAEMFTFINGLIPDVGDGKKYTIDQAKTLIFEEQAKIEAKYRKKAEEAALEKVALSTTEPATKEEVTAWKKGDAYPWRDKDGSWIMKTSELADDYENLARALQTDPENLGNVLQETRLGKMVAPLIAAGEDINDILEIVAQDIIKENERDKTIDLNENPTSTPNQPSVDLDGDGRVDAGSRFEGRLMNSLSRVMQEFNLTSVLQLPQSYTPTNYIELLSDSGGFSGMYLYEDANGTRYISPTKPDKYGLTNTENE